MEKPLKQVSQIYVLIQNLHNTAFHHKEYCNDPSCNVSIFQLKKAAEQILATCGSLVIEEIDDLETMVKVMPIT